MREETGTAASLEEEEVVKYTREVLREVMKEKARKQYHECQNDDYSVN